MKTETAEREKEEKRKVLNIIETRNDGCKSKQANYVRTERLYQFRSLADENGGNELKIIREKIVFVSSFVRSLANVQVVVCNHHKWQHQANHLCCLFDFKSSFSRFLDRESISGSMAAEGAQYFTTFLPHLSFGPM